MTPERLAEIRADDSAFNPYPNPNGVYGHRRDLLAYVDELRRELADLRPYAEAGRQLAAKQAESEYYHGTCDGCSCCTTAQCREGRCPENSIGDSICPCTCD